MFLKHCVIKELTVNHEQERLIENVSLRVIQHNISFCSVKPELIDNTI